MSKLRREIKAAINSASAENGSNTPDYILAEYLITCLAAFDTAVTLRDRFYEIAPAPGRTLTEMGRRPQQITCGMCGTMYTTPGAFLPCPTCPR